ncbi:MAG: RNA polymerase sigma factor [Gaiellaceae bacterium]
MKTDAALLAAARTEAAPFRELYDRYAAAVHGFHLRRTRDEQVALDLTAETFAQAWLSRGRFRDESGGSAGPWLFGIARNLLAQSVRKRRLELGACTKLGLLDGLDREPSTIEPSSLWLDGLDEALAELPEGQRGALELRVVDDLEYDDVAARLGTTPAAARVRVTRGLGHLRQRLAGSEREAI